jgi:glutamate synthase domain-containing protein 2
MLPSRYFVLAACIALALLSLLAALQLHPAWYWSALLFGVLGAIGIRDLVQTRSSVLRNYPIMAHFRFLFESIRPEIRQYFLEDDYEETPFSRVQRSIVYQRAKNALDKRPFGTQLDVYAPQYEWVNHSMLPADIETHDFRVQIGNAQCARPTRPASSTSRR